MFSIRDRDEPRRHGIPSAASEPIATFRNDSPLKAHADYTAAKAGDQDAAERLVQDLVPAENVDAARARFGTNVIYAPVVAEELTGRNAIPWTLAAYYAEQTGASMSVDVIQSNRAHHTGAKAMERLMVRAQFAGEVVAGGCYVLVDDVSVMGSTLADMADHLQRSGGAVVGVVTLVNASRMGVLTPTQARIRAIERRFGNDIEELFGVEASALTAGEAGYILNFKDVDALRARLAAASRERRDRLRAKGIREEEVEPGPSDEENGTPSGAR